MKDLQLVYFVGTLCEYSLCMLHCKSAHRASCNCPDCYLRQGAGGMKIARFGSRTCFLRWFHNRSETYFGQNSEEHAKTIKTRHMEVKNDDFLEKCVTLKTSAFFLNLSRSSKARAGPIRTHMGPYGLLWAHMGSKNPPKYIKSSHLYVPLRGLSPCLK